MGTNVEIKRLPETVQRALKAGGYNKRDIKVEARESVCLQTSGGDGYRGLAIVINMRTGERREHLGSWGGANPFETKRVDVDSQDHVLPVDGAAFVGVTGHRTWGTLYVRPDAMPALLPPPADIPERVSAILAIFDGIKAGTYRREALLRANVAPEEIEELIVGGYLKQNAAGSITITTAGKNARGNAKVF